MGEGKQQGEFRGWPACLWRNVPGCRTRRKNPNKAGYARGLKRQSSASGEPKVTGTFRAELQREKAKLWGSAVCPLQFSAHTEVPRGWERPWNRESGTMLRVHAGQKEVPDGHGALSTALRKPLLSIKGKLAQTQGFSEPT